MSGRDFAEAGGAVAAILAITCAIGLVAPWAIRFFTWYWLWVLQ